MPPVVWERPDGAPRLTAPGDRDGSRILAHPRTAPRRWTTLHPPGVGAGAPGGPLLLEFENGIVGADVFISGGLERTGSPPARRSSPPVAGGLTAGRGAGC